MPHQRVHGGHYSEGLDRQEHELDAEHVGRFSTGQESEPHPNRSGRAGHFSEGQDRTPDDEEKRHVGRWADGEPVDDEA
jgi:hypothetical protein